MLLTARCAAPQDPSNFPIFHPTSFRPYPLETYKRDREQIVKEVLAGITVVFALVPESVAFAFLAGCSTEQALHAAWIVGLVMALTGSRPCTIAAASGAHAAVLAGKGLFFLDWFWFWYWFSFFKKIGF